MNVIKDTIADSVFVFVSGHEGRCYFEVQRWWGSESESVRRASRARYLSSWNSPHLTEMLIQSFINCIFFLFPLAKINETDTFGPGDDDEIQFDDIGDDDEDIDDVSANAD